MASNRRPGMPAGRWLFRARPLAAAAVIAGAALLVSSAPAGAATVAAPQAAAVTCSGNGCNNTDPFATGCGNSGAYEVAGVPIYKGSTSVVAGYAQLWYSSTCGTNWTEVVVNNDGLNDIFYEYGQLNIADGRSLSYGYNGYGTPLWTNQEYAPTVTAQACGQILADSFTTAKTCTGWY